MASIKFYSASDAIYGCFSNFSDHAVFINGKEYPTTEHYFQVRNFKKNIAIFIAHFAWILDFRMSIIVINNLRL